LALVRARRHRGYSNQTGRRRHVLNLHVGARRRKRGLTPHGERSVLP
jgi:hypothetical protein